MPDPIRLRLNDAGAIEGNTRRTIEACLGTELRLHVHGVEVVRPKETTLVPWSSIATVTFKTPTPPEQSKPTQSGSPEKTIESKRPVRAAKRAGATARRPKST